MIIAIVVIFVACVYVFLKKNEDSSSRPPLASGAWPIVGHAIKILTSLEELYNFVRLYSMQCVRGCGAITIRFLTTDIYVVADAADACTVLNSCLEKDTFYGYIKPWLGEGLVSATEDVWKKHSKLLSPTFHQAALDRYLVELNKQARNLVIRLEDKAGQGRFNHAEDLEHVTLQSICSTAMGVMIDDRDVELREHYLRAKSMFFAGIVARAQKFWLHSEFFYNLSSLKKIQNRLADTLHGLTNAIIRKRKEALRQKGPETENDKRFKPFMDYLLDMEKAGVLSSREVQEEVDTFTFAGSDTTSITLANALVIVGTYPDVQRKIVQELQEIFQGSNRDVEKENLLQLKYLEAVVKETLRLHPPVPFVGRILDKDVKIKNFTLPSGTRCYVTLYGINRHPSWGPDAEQFRPERWLDPTTVPSHQFASFSFGKRRCSGSNLAMMSMKTTLAHVLRKYRVSGDVTELVHRLEVLAKPVPKKYISIERRIFTTI